MAFLGADTDELREVGQQFQEGKETTDQVITYLKALIAILRAASVFTGGASAAYATYLETVVVPWLERISAALGMFAQVLGAQAEAQDTASDPSTIDYGSLPSYAPQGQNPAPITPYEGPPVTGNPGGQGVPTPTDAGATSSGPGLTIGDNGHLMIDTGIDLDGPDGAATGGGQTGAPIGTSGIGSAASAGPSSTGPADFGRGGIDSGMGDLGGGSGGGSGGGTGGGGGGPAPGLGGGSVDGGSAFDGSTAGGAGSPFAHNGGLADGGMGGTTPGSEALGATGMGDATPAASESNGPSYGAAAGIAGGAAALGLGGAALAARGGGTGTGTPAGNEIDRLASGNGRGSSGAEVTELQQRLTEAGYDTQGVDGKWGPATQAAYDAYRGDNPLPVQAGQGYSSPSGYDYNQIAGVRGNSHVTPEFLREVEGMSQRLGARPEHILAAMSFETGGSFDPGQKNNAGGSATGLIQFMPDTPARGLGTSTAALAQMTPTEQLQYVEKYFEPHRGRLGDLEGVYTSILSGSPRSGDEALFTQGTRAYSANSALDVNNNGVITAAEATQHVRARMGSGAGN